MSGNIDGETIGRLSGVNRSRLLREQVYEILESRIINRTLAPGTRLVETEVAEMLGVSRNPVREALHLLHQDGWVDIRPQQGSLVHVPTVTEIRQFFQVRVELERASVRLAAKSPDRRKMFELQPLVKEGIESLRRGDYDVVTRLNSQIHLSIALLTGNDYLVKICSGLAKKVRWYLTPELLLHGEQRWIEHQQLVESIGRGDGETAAEVMVQHIEAMLEAYLARTDNDHETGSGTGCHRPAGSGPARRGTD